MTLVDRESDLDRKLSRDEWKFASGLGLNYRAPTRPHPPAQKPHDSLHPAGPRSEPSSTRPRASVSRSRRKPPFVDPERCTLCGRCEAVCPVTTPQGTKPIDYPGRKALPGRPAIDKRRQPLCQAHCPLGVNAQGYIALTRAGRYQEALDLVRQENVLPAICGRVCTHPCEADCRRGLLDEPVDIRNIKRFLADHEAPSGRSIPSQTPSRKEKVAVIGSRARQDLRRRLTWPVRGTGSRSLRKRSSPEGSSVTESGPTGFREKSSTGTCNTSRAWASSSRLPSDQTSRGPRQAKTGIRCRNLGRRGLDRPQAWRSRRGPEGVEGCIAFLNRLYRGEIHELKENVAVIGDGNSAFDLARALVRIGARVTLLSWFPEEIIPAAEDEVRGAERGKRLPSGQDPGCWLLPAQTESWTDWSAGPRSPGSQTPRVSPGL